MSQCRLIYISNDDKDTSESKSNSEFVCYLKENVSVQESNYLVVKSITLPNFFYNVRDATYGESQNNILVFQEAAPLATFAVEIPAGQYLLSDLITTIENLMNGVLVSGTVAITVNPTTQKLLFTCTGTSISIFSGNNGNLAYTLIGASETFNTLLFPINPMPFLPDLSGLQNVYLESRELARSHGNDPSFGLIDIVGEVNLSTTEFGAYSHYEAPETELNTINFLNTRNIQRIDIRLVDNKGSTLPIGNGRISLTLKYYYD
jgi:hypothetical protein